MDANSFATALMWLSASKVFCSVLDRDLKILELLLSCASGVKKQLLNGSYVGNPLVLSCWRKDVLKV